MSSSSTMVEPAEKTGSTTISSLWRPVVAALGAAALTAAALTPVWGTRLVAPQYPKGLKLWVYGGKATGDVREVNALNHYIGMRTLDVSNVPELRLWPWVVAMVVGFFLGALLLKGWWRKLSLVGLWATPIGVLADIQRWLIVFGTNLDERAALRLEPFTPWVIGPTKIWNFDVWSYPGPALGTIIAAALAATIIRRAAYPSPRVGVGTLVVVLAIQIAATVLWVAPALTIEPPAETAAVPVTDFDLAAEVASARPGDTIVVPAGRHLVNLVVSVPLTLVGEPGAVIDGGGRGSVVTIEAPDVVVRDLEVVNSGGQIEEGAGIKVLGDRVSIEDNVIEESYTGISVQGARQVRLVGNQVTGTGQVTVGAGHAMGVDQGEANAGGSTQGDGISLWDSEGALIRDNRVESVRDGIYLNFAREVMVDTNQILASRYALHGMYAEAVTVFDNDMVENLAGVVLMFTKDVDVARNRLTDSRSEGAGVAVILKDASTVMVMENVIARNRVGLQSEGSIQIGGESAIVGNRIASNRIGVALASSSDLFFGSNSFEDNLTQVWALGPGVDRKNTWSYHGAGNHWSDYPGYDLGDDGLGDVPYVAGGDAQALLAAAPSLEAYRLSPAYRLLEASQTWWSTRRPIVEDRRPLSVDIAPPAIPPRTADSPVAWYATGSTLLATSLVFRVRMGRAG